MTDSWLIVWGGDVNKGTLAEALLAASPSHPEAHEIRFGELGGPRQAILLVHYSEGERNEVLERIRDEWEFGFVNAVVELK